MIESLKEFGIPVRESHRPHLNPSQAKFGEKVIKGKVEVHLGEKRIIEAVKMLHDQGLSLRQIAGVLTKMKIPTKQRGYSWHPEMVRRILERMR